jgi:ribosomal-protein-alanine N-acetyltransferase
MNGLETERLVLRPFTMDDLEDVHREVFSDPEVCHFYCGNTKTLDETAEWLTYRITEWKYSSFGRLAIVLKESQEFAGFVGLESYVNSYCRFADNPNPPHNEVEVELSFALGQRFWKKGYAFEASQAMIRYAFDELKLPQLVGGAHLENERSRKLQERLGYRVELNAHPDWPGYATILQNDRATNPANATP